MLRVRWISNSRADEGAAWAIWLRNEELREVGRGCRDPVAPAAVVGDGAFVDDRHETGGAEAYQVMADGGLGQFELLADLRHVEIVPGQQLEDSQPCLVSERAMQPDDRRARGQP